MAYTLALSLAFLLSICYALFLALTEPGQWLRQEMTWLSVVVGVGMTLGCMALVDVAAAQVAAVFFAVTGAPIVIESLIRMYRNWREAQRKLLEPRNGE